jgi:dipeptide/tripeptide permease
MKTKEKVRTGSKRIVLVSAIILFAGSLAAINIEQFNPLEKNTSTLFITLMFFSLFLIYLGGSLMNESTLKRITYAERQRRHQHHYRKIIKKTA